jgi:DNA-binding transcriptional ArsR family regulator
MTSQQAMRGDADVAAVAALFADPARARILRFLADGRAHPASALASEAGIAASSASAHLTRLVEGGLLHVQPSGRHRYYRLADERAAAGLEVLAALAPPLPIRSLAQHSRAAALRRARTCYDHLAGQLGVNLTQALLDHRALERLDGGLTVARADDDPFAAPLSGAPYRLGPDAEAVLNRLGVDLKSLQTTGSKRPLLRFCVDWSEQQHHIAGALGAAIHHALRRDGYIEPMTQHRAVRLTGQGRAALFRSLGLELDDPLAS